ncbi:hypothetical protein ACQ4M4_12810 [Leptolyngbya sp. AN02str]|uniref:hypothetical protein n=1 Tax=Leptolyngbya sp. AN02str TaxID=3423363 RepID=UPI003D323E64
MIYIYSPVSEDLVKDGEEFTSIVDKADEPVEVGDLVSMGGDRQWRVMATESYTSESGVICLALVIPDSEEVPDASQWTHNILRDGEQLSFCVYRSEAGTVTYGWMMHGSVPGGKLTAYEPTEHPTLMKPGPDEWSIDAVETFVPEVESPVFDHVYVAKLSKLEPVAA